MPAPDTYYPDNLAIRRQMRRAAAYYDQENGTTWLDKLNTGAASLEEVALATGADTHMPAGNLLQRIYDLESAANITDFLTNNGLTTS